MLPISRKARLFMSSFFIVLLSTHVHAAEVQSLRQEDKSQIKVEGKIVDIGTDRIVVQTPTTKYTVSKKTIPLKAHIGDKVTLWVTPKHVVVDHHRQVTGQQHRFMVGTLLDAKSRNQIKLWTPEGNQVYSLVEHDTKVEQFPEGTMVTVEVDEAGNVLDLYPVESEIAACDKRHHCKVMIHGIVSKTENGMIFIRTPVVEYELAANLAPANTAPDDEMTLWAYENSVVLDRYKAGDTTRHRFVTGPLRYADKTRTHITLWTPEGEQAYALPRPKMGGLRENHPITLEVNENGEVIDLWQS